MTEFNLNYDVRESAPTIARFHWSNADFKAIEGPIGCMSADTEFLTPTGWKRIDQYVESDKVAQWHLNGGMEFVSPEAYIVLPCSELIWFRNKSLSMQLSEEHRVPVYDWAGRFTVKLAGYLEKKPSSNRIPTTFVPLCADAPISDALLRLAVAVNADAHHCKVGGLTRICVRKERKKVRLRRVLGACSISFREKQSRTRPTEVTFTFESPYKGKTYIDWHWWALSQRQLQIVVEEMSHWDGLFEGADTRFHSGHNCDADFMQYAVHAIGGKASISKVEYDNPGWNPCYVVHIALPGSIKAVARLRKDSVRIDRAKTKDGKKYCFTVPTGFFIARHNGFIFITGNSGKSVACCIEIFRRCQEQKVGEDGFRRSRWAVIRNTRGELRDTTLKTWNDWFPSRVGIGYWKETTMTYHLEFGDVKAEILFRPLDTPADVSKVLSLELTGAWLNECKQIVQEIVEGLQGRLERYPSRKMGGSNYWMMIADTNMPAVGSYWWKIFERQPLEDDDPDTIVQCDTFRQPSGISDEAENICNLEPGYYKRKATGRSKAYVNVYIKAQYALSQAGKPVYHDSFRYDRHVSKTSLPIHPTLPVIVGNDWGLTPAGLWMQMQEDGRIFVLRETAAFDMGAKRYLRSKFRPMQLTMFPTNPIVVVGDPSGTRRADSDEGTCFKEVKKAGYTARAAHTNDPDVRIKVFDDLFSEYPDMKPRIMIDPACKSFINAMRSNYRYKRKKLSAGEEYEAKPDKSQPCSHLVEGGQYGAMFLTGRRYDPADYTVYDEFDPLQFTQVPYRPAQKEGY